MPASLPQHDQIVVTGRRGAADMAPEIELNADEIDALGAYDIGEVIQRTVQSNALGDDPVVIVNGQRVANPGVFSRFPSDALVRVEVLPRGAGAQYGGDSSRRVLNIVLQRRFKSRDGQFDAQAPAAGGMSSLSGDIRQGAISGNSTTQFGIRAARDTALLGAERSQYLEDHPGHEAVSLRPSVQTMDANLALTRALGRWSSSLNIQGQVRSDRAISLSGGEPIESRHSTRNLLVIGGLSGSLLGWSLQASLTGQLSASSQSGLADTASRQQSLATAMSANRRIFNLPAGPVTVNLTMRASLSRTSILGAGPIRAFSARDLSLGGTVSLPLWRTPSPGNGSAIERLLGSMSATFGGTLRQTDAGQGKGLSAGLIWMPMTRLRLIGNWSTSIDSVPDAQRFAPAYYGAPITVFDFVTGESAQVLPILGGTPDLLPPRFDRIALSASAGPFSPWNLTGSVSLQRSNAVNGIGSLPEVTPELEAAFPARFTRDAGGRLTTIDRRPINFRSARAESLASNLSITFPLGGAKPGTLRIAINHNLQLRNLTMIHAGLPEMDRLVGDGGGVPRHQLDVQMDGRDGPWGVNLAARWRSAYRVRRDTGRDGPEDLLVSAIGTVDLKFSYALARTIRPSHDGATPRRAAGMQFGLDIDNLFDTRPSARLGRGSPAPGYGRDDQDPVGRTIRLTIRNRF
ncbi:MULTISPECIES: TonB-dependent receptor [unclassified Sphingomonas]|uniref:TonB-dependent receptor n=6 Tax=Pseudomonadota TaxID=1224 RepID=UPI00148571F1|nr:MULTISPECIES: TonB-dependent receptor [unclassified Sphingomonas]